MEYFSAYPFLEISGNIVTEIVQFPFGWGLDSYYRIYAERNIGTENTLWNRIECNILKYYCSDTFESCSYMETVSTALNSDSGKKITLP